MIIRSFDDPDVGGFDLRNYAPICAQGAVTIPTSLSYSEIINIAGEGFITIASCVTGYAKMTVDGVLKTFSGGATIVGFCVDAHVNSSNDSSDYPRVKSCNATSSKVLMGEAAFINNYTTGAGSVEGLLTADIPIFFNNSFTLQVSHFTSGGKVGYYVRGGVLI